jgi:signal transduction histidine kinase/ActR/RegA family two-component response regulator
MHRLVGHILVEDGDLLARWRARLTAIFLSATATLGVPPTLNTLYALAREGAWSLAVLDASLLVAVYVLLLSHRVSNRARNVFLTMACTAIGVLAMIVMGPFSTALGWLFMAVFLAAFLLGPRSTALVVFVVLSLLLGVGIGIELEVFPWARDVAFAASRWRIIAFDYTFLIVIFAGANSLIIRLLEREDAARARAEQQLAEGRRHEALGTLASGIAHDFNNLLVPLLANVESAQGALTRDSDAHAALVDAQRTAERARDLVQRILSFGRRADAPRRALDLAATVRDSVALARVSAPKAVHLEAHCGTAPPVHASEAELHQIVHNLVTNAVHATTTAGTIVVALDTVTDTRGRFARIRVADTGVGMDATTRERIFDPYFSTRTAGRGTGLGLPIVRSLVTALGGEIDVQSTVGEGSTFTVLLPETAAVSTDLATPVDAPAASLRPGTHVLLVDDEDGVRRATQRQLTALGCVVTPAQSAEDALRLLDERSAPFDVMLTDHRMPGRSGVELATLALAIDRDLRVVLMSGDIEEARRGVPSDAAIVPLQKPFARAELARALNDALGTRAEAPTS